MERAQTFAYLPSSSFLVLIWLISLWGFGACRDLDNKLKFTENGFRMKNLLRFRFWSFSRFIFYREVSPFYIWFYTPLLDYDVFLHHLVVLVVVIPTSPRTSKTEFGYSSYARFSVGIFLQFYMVGSTGVLPAKRVSVLVLSVFYAVVPARFPVVPVLRSSVVPVSALR